MRTLAQPAIRDATVARLDRLTADRAPAWGRMSAPQVMAHMADALRMALGDLPCRPKHVPLARVAPLKQILLYWVPIPKNMPTARELVEREPGAIDDERAACASLVARFDPALAPTRWPEHPLFGALDGRQWGVIAYRHLDHHLRQFGV